ncbi:UNVERIFIED_CONTAM: hypothetical protein GTU68_046137 [Idotea baltica]|nr:hypothetical protein [Idotea baltica]
MHVRIFLSRYRSYTTCRVCKGGRLQPEALNFKVEGRTLPEFWKLSIDDLLTFLEKLNAREGDRTGEMLLDEVRNRLRFLQEVGLGYLNLDRPTRTLSGGETERVNLTTCLGATLTSTLFVLDEPTVGLHPRDVGKLIGVMNRLRDLGNTLVVVEHNLDVMKCADHIIDLGPEAGVNGGELVAAGTPEEIAKSKKSHTGCYLRDVLPKIVQAWKGDEKAENAIQLYGARENNLKNVSLAIPRDKFVVVTGLSGSGKSTLAFDILFAEGQRRFLDNKARPKTWKTISGGIDRLETVYEVDQSPIGKTSRSTPATYVKVFDEIRKMFANLPEARARGYTASRFSFNTEGGRCEPCKGNGQIKLEMNFLPTSYIKCEECHGRRFNDPTLEVEYNGKSIGDVMDMSIAEAAEFFSGHPKISRTLGLMNDTGLGYLKLGQPSPTVSGGEAQRIKLVSELTRRKPKSNVYLIEEPSIGLHMSDVKRLLEVLHRLADDGHTVVVIEHNLDIIAEADYLIDIGPEAGEMGGVVVAEGTPEDVAKSKESRTAPFLAKVLNK